MSVSWAVVLEIIGWIGSAAIVFSVLQTHFMRFRIVNAIASAILVFYNACLGVWPAVAMNAVLVSINLYFILSLRQRQAEGKVFTYTAAASDRAALDWFVARHRDDIAVHFPNFEPTATAPATEAVLIFHEDTAMGLVVFRRDGATSAELIADYVIPSYRDFAPGQFVYSSAGPLTAANLTVVWAVQPSASAAPYLAAMGFERDHDEYIRELVPEASRGSTA